MPFDSPSLGGYTLQNPPDNMAVFWEAVNQVNELADGGFRQRILGYRLRATLEWNSSWIRRQDLTGLAAVANDTTGAAGTGLGALTFIPRPTTYPTRTYAVIWTNKMQFTFHEGHFGVYGGSIELVSANPTATVGELP